MHLPTHLLMSWGLANAVPLERRDRTYNIEAAEMTDKQVSEDKK
jgi:hypothetical protein